MLNLLNSLNSVVLCWLVLQRSTISIKIVVNTQDKVMQHLFHKFLGECRPNAIVSSFLILLLL